MAVQRGSASIVNIIIPPSYRQLRSAAPFDSVSLGYTTLHLHPFAELSAAQQGYGIVSDGDETDWDSAWVVIGYGLHRRPHLDRHR